jgi:hypothetical protein
VAFETYTSSYNLGTGFVSQRREPEQNTNGTSSASSSSPSSPHILLRTGPQLRRRMLLKLVIVFHHLSVLLSSRSELADKMVSACAYASRQIVPWSLLLHLLESTTTLRIDSPELEKWLGDRKDPNLLWRYYNVLGNIFKRGKYRGTEQLMRR